MNKIVWSNMVDLPSKSFTCGYCGNPLASMKGWAGQDPKVSNLHSYIYVCHHCSNPTYFNNRSIQFPGITYGNTVKDIPDESVRVLYEEARRAIGSGCYTASVLCCRKLLMHIAVSKGATPGDNFLRYVEYLTDNHYVPPDAKIWVDHIRKLGNEANHEILIVKDIDAKELFEFVEMLLKVIYEFPAAIKKKTLPNKDAT